MHFIKKHWQNLTIFVLVLSMLTHFLSVSATEGTNTATLGASSGTTQTATATLQPTLGSSQLSPFALVTETLSFDQIYDSVLGRYKTFAEIQAAGLLTAPFDILELKFDNTDPTIYEGIQGLPTGVTTNIVVYGTATATYVGINTKVNTIKTSGLSDGLTYGGIVVLGQGEAESITVLENSDFNAEKAIRSLGPTVGQGPWEWYTDNAPTKARPSVVTGVIIGAYDGGKINGDITIAGGNQVNAGYSNEIGYLGCVVGAYESASVGNIYVGGLEFDPNNYNFTSLAMGYVQMAVGANGNSTVGDIKIGYNVELFGTKTGLAVVGAASGPNADKPSTAKLISMTVFTNIYVEGYRYGSDPSTREPDINFSNVIIGSENGSHVDKITISEAHSYPDMGYNSMYLSSSSYVTIGTYNGTIGTGSGDAILLENVNIWDGSYYAGGLSIGADNNGTINGDIHLKSFGLNSNFNYIENSEFRYDTVIGATNNSAVNGTIWLDAFEHAGSYISPSVIIGAATNSTVNEVKVDIFTSIAANWYSDSVTPNSIIGSSNGGNIGKITINGDLFISKPKAQHGEMDLVADSIVIMNGNIVVFDVDIMFNTMYDYYAEPSNRYILPPWVEESLVSSVPLVNQFGDPVSVYNIVLDPNWIDAASEPIYVANGSTASYEYKFGNDFTKYLEGMGFEGEGTQLGHMRPSWAVYLYPIWERDLSYYEFPFVHQVYLPDSDINPVSYIPIQSGNYQVATTTSVALTKTINMDELIFGSPVVSIYDDATGVLVSRFHLNNTNKNKFALNYDDNSDGRLGSHLTLYLLNIPGITLDTLYRVEIKSEQLHNKAAYSNNPIIDVNLTGVGTNPNLISWKFFMHLNTHTVTATGDGNGSVKIDKALHHQGDYISLAAVPNPGYHFKEWVVVKGNVQILKQANASFIMPDEDVEIMAVFEINPPNTYTIIVSSTGNGTASSNKTYAAIGEIVTLTAQPSPDSRFVRWVIKSGAVVLGTGSTVSFIMPGNDVSVVAEFELLPVNPIEPEIPPEDPTKPDYGDGGTIRSHSRYAIQKDKIDTSEASQAKLEEKIIKEQPIVEEEMPLEFYNPNTGR